MEVCEPHPSCGDLPVSSMMLAELVIWIKSEDWDSQAVEGL